MRDTLIGQDTDTGEDVHVAYGSRPLGVAIIGKSGTGKSSLLEHLILADLAQGTPGMVIDPHGLLAERIVRLTPPEHAHRLMLLEAIRSKPFGLNLLAVRDPIDEDDDPVTWAADSVIATVKKLYGEDDEFLPRLERYLDLAVRTLIPAQRTLLDAPRLFDDTGFRDTCLSRVARDDQATLRAGWASYDRLRPGERITHTEALVNRLERLLAPPIIRGIIGCPRTSVPFEDLLAGETMLVVSLPSDRLSPERCDFLGALLLCALADRIFARSVTAVPSRVHLYLDEYQRFATSTTAELLTQGRKYGVGVTLAHQDLHQIRDIRIRNASRHAGTLIVLGVTRPDAEELAGEFPISPREEWVETVEEVDGTEPKLVPSPTPAEDIYLNGHSNPVIDKVARSFFAYSPKWTMEAALKKLGYTRQEADMVEFLGDNRKSAGIEPRPGGFPLDERVKVPAYDVNGLLVDAMAGNRPDSDMLFSKLLRAETWVPQVRLSLPEDPAFGTHTMVLREEGLSTMYFFLENKSPNLIPEPQCDCSQQIDINITRGPERYTIGRDRRHAADDPLGLHLIHCKVRPLSEKDRAHNGMVWKLYRQWAEGLIHAVNPWLNRHLCDLEALWEGKYTDSFRQGDKDFMYLAWTNRWNGQWQWEAPVGLCPDGQPGVDTREEKDKDHELYGKRLEEFMTMCTIARFRIRYLTQLCDGLYKEPVLVPSGEQKPRIRARHIVHPAQSEHDALAEFAKNMVNPQQRYVAYVRLPSGYHQVRLAPPLGGPENTAQLQQIRIRSQQRYHCPESTREGSPAPGERPDSQGPPVIERRPRTRLEPPDDLPAEDEGTA